MCPRDAAPAAALALVVLLTGCGSGASRTLTSNSTSRPATPSAPMSSAAVDTTSPAPSNAGHPMTAFTPAPATPPTSAARTAALQLYPNGGGFSSACEQTSGDQATAGSGCPVTDRARRAIDAYYAQGGETDRCGPRYFGAQVARTVSAGATTINRDGSVTVTLNRSYAGGGNDAALLVVERLSGRRWLADDFSTTVGGTTYTLSTSRLECAPPR